MSEVSLVEAAVVIALIVCVVSWLLTSSAEVTVVRSDTDWRHYLVRNLPDKQQAADLMASVNADMIRLVNHMRVKYRGDADVARLVANFNPDNVCEAGEGGQYTSYTTNKGESINLCVRSKDKDRKLVDRNLLMFVAIHELAHVMTLDVGHTESFWANNRRLLREATALGIYKEVDYTKQPQQYCGMTISSNV